MIPADRTQRTILVETVFTPDDLRAVFSQCGVIRGIFAAGCANDVALYRYYVEFRDPEAVGYACALQLAGTAVYMLDYPGIVNDFLAVAQPDLFRKPVPNVINSTGWSVSPESHNTQKTHSGKVKSRPSTYTVIEPATPTPQHPGPVPALRLPARVDFTSTSNDGHCVLPLSLLEPATKPRPVLPGSDVPPPMDAYRRSCGTALPPRPPSPAGTNPFLPKRPSDVQVTNPFPTMHGQPHGLQLDRLELDEVIATLKATANGIDGRAKWFTAGSDYYRLKDFPAAIAVLTAMVEVMLGNGLEESDLRPAILLLADCYRHLARRLGGNPNNPEAIEDSKLLNAQSIELLRKVFGPSGIPSMFHDSVVAPPSTPAPTPAAGVPLGPSKSINAPAPNDRHTTPASPNHGQVKILQREVESLRDRHRHQQDALSRERTAKRKLEDSLGSERHRRRRLEDDLKKVEKSALSSRRGEEYAIDRCRVEHETRRRAESQVEELKGYIAKIEPMLEKGEENDKKTKEYLRKVAISLMKAADGNLTAALPTLKQV